MKIVRQARGKLSADDSTAWMIIQSFVGWLTRDHCLRKAHLLVAGGDPILWALCALHEARKRPGSTVAIAMPAVFQGAPLGALYDEDLRRSVKGVHLPGPDRADMMRFMNDVAAEFTEAGGRILTIADPIRAYEVKRGIMALLDRTSTVERPGVNASRENFGLDLLPSSQNDRSLAFGDLSESAFLRSKSCFLEAFKPVTQSYPAGQRYCDAVFVDRIKLATLAQSHALLNFDVRNDKVDVCEFCVSSSETISNAVEAWVRDLRNVISGDF